MRPERPAYRHVRPAGKLRAEAVEREHALSESDKNLQSMHASMQRLESTKAMLADKLDECSTALKGAYILEEKYFSPAYDVFF